MFAAIAAPHHGLASAPLIAGPVILETHVSERLPVRVADDEAFREAHRSTVGGPPSGKKPRLSGAFLDRGFGGRSKAVNSTDRIQFPGAT